LGLGFIVEGPWHSHEKGLGGLGLGNRDGDQRRDRERVRDRGCVCEFSHRDRVRGIDRHRDKKQNER